MTTRPSAMLVLTCDFAKCAEFLKKDCIFFIALLHGCGSLRRGCLALCRKHAYEARFYFSVCIRRADHDDLVSGLKIFSGDRVAEFAYVGLRRDKDGLFRLVIVRN